MTSPYGVEGFDWTDARAEEARRIRFSVFVDEQKVPAELELDEIDAVAHHVLAYDADGNACGTGRLFADADDPSSCHVGRMAVLADYRGTGCGVALMAKLLEIARQRGFREATLSAQVHALAFYERLGFVAEGPVYDDAGIPHRKMRLVIGKTLP